MTAIEAMIYCLGDVGLACDDVGENLMSRMVRDKNGDRHWIYWDVEIEGDAVTPELQSEVCGAFAIGKEPYRLLTEETTK